MKLSLGASAVHFLLITLAYYLTLPSNFCFSLLLATFAPAWWVVLKFIFAIIKDNPKIRIPVFLSYFVAIVYYFYKFGLSTNSILYMLYGFSVVLSTLYLYRYVFNTLDNEGVKSYRWKAIPAFAISFSFGVALLLIAKTAMLI